MKTIKLIFSLIVPLLITACSSGTHVNSRNNPMASLFGENSDDENTFNNSSSNNDSNSNQEAPVYDHIDIDLTTMNATMVYSEVYDMMSNPSSYVNKVVKASGPFAIATGSYANICYPAVLIRDATACCANGLEFLLYGVPLCTRSGGNGYPVPNEEITVVGVFKTYLEDASLYVHLVDAIWIR